MQLIDTQTSQLLIEFRGKETIIHNKFLEEHMRTIGILIPHGLRGLYHGKDCIYLEDIDFQKAFKEIYYPTMMNPKKFQWLIDHPA